MPHERKKASRARSGYSVDAGGDSREPGRPWRSSDCRLFERGNAGEAPAARGASQVRMNDMNSALVLGSVSKEPRMALETVVLRCFCTPRIIMQVWLASITTATP